MVNIIGKFSQKNVCMNNKCQNVIDINKANESKECDICHCWYFLDKHFKHEQHLCKVCHDLMEKAMNFNDVASVSIKGSDYRINFWYTSKDDAINMTKNFNLN